MGQSGVGVEMRGREDTRGTLPSAIWMRESPSADIPGWARAGAQRDPYGRLGVLPGIVLTHTGLSLELYILGQVPGQKRWELPMGCLHSLPLWPQQPLVTAHPPLTAPGMRLSLKLQGTWGSLVWVWVSLFPLLLSW